MRVYLGRMESQEKMEVKACRETRVMMGRQGFLVNLADVVKPASQDSQEIRGE